MIRNKQIAVIVPVFNEERKIQKTLETIPVEVDTIYVVDDCSSDSTIKLVEKQSKIDNRIQIIQHAINKGVGAAIVTGYKTVIENSEDIAVVMAGDGQMDPIDFPNIVNIVVDDFCDYSKGNRFLRGRNELSKIPKHRLLGNLVLSILTKIVSGYWHVSDSQGGFTAINRRALLAVDWDQCYPRYGCPNDYLVQLNIAQMRVCDLPITAVYGSEWSSKMKPKKVIFPIIWLLGRLFFKRIIHKYAIKDGHPIVLSYMFAFMSFAVSVLFLSYIIYKTLSTGVIPQTASIFLGMTFIISVQLFLNSFEMDYKYNERLYIQPK